MNTLTSNNASSTKASPPPTTDISLIDTSVLNPRGYPPFDLRHVSTYSNRQLRYYHAYRVLLSVNQAKMQAKMNKRKANIEIVGQDKDTRENTPNAITIALSIVPLPLTRTFSLNKDSKSNSDCPKAPLGYKGIKFNVVNLTKLSYDSDLAKYNDWLIDLKVAFKGDPTKFPNSGQKIIQASMTLEGQLKSTYNTATNILPTIMTY